MRLRIFLFAFKIANMGGGGASETGTWKTVDDDGRFPSLVDLFLRHGGSLETVEELIRGVKARADQEMCGGYKPLYPYG